METVFTGTITNIRSVSNGYCLVEVHIPNHRHTMSGKPLDGDVVCRDLEIELENAGIKVGSVVEVLQVEDWDMPDEIGYFLRTDN